MMFIFQPEYAARHILLPCWIALAGFLLAAAPVSAAVKCEAAPYIASAGRAYDQAARLQTAAAFGAAIARFSDIRSTALSALGRYRKALPRARETEYVNLTRTFMAEFMLEYGKDFRASGLEITDCSGADANLLVQTVTPDGDRIGFRVSRAGSGYTIRDIRVRGIWMVQQMRSTFVGTISRGNGDIEELFEFLRR